MVYVVCPQCNNRWEYIGESDDATCTRCKHSFTVFHRGQDKTKKTGRTLGVIKPPEDMDVGTYEGQKWVLKEIHRLRSESLSLNATDIKILNDMRDDMKALKELDVAYLYKQFRKEMDDLKKELGLADKK